MSSLQTVVLSKPPYSITIFAIHYRFRTVKRVGF